MLSGRVDATLGGYWNYEAIQLAQRGKHPNVIRMDQVGVPTYDELVLVVRRKHDRQPARPGPPLRAGDGARVRVGSAATRRPRSTRSSRPTPGSTAKLQLASVKATLPVFFPSRRASRGDGRTRRSGTPTGSG